MVLMDAMCLSLPERTQQTIHFTNSATVSSPALSNQILTDEGDSWAWVIHTGKTAQEERTAEVRRRDGVTVASFT